ncbi:MAG: hypothetical protein JSS23_05180 [Proteobacteria bacterium]|nr:hypothetical protein [Pseudomonadota bacterium]MBS0229837.1 hypothetical protein [Pseudomonadota bacterium]
MIRPTLTTLAISLALVLASALSAPASAAVRCRDDGVIHRDCRPPVPRQLELVRLDLVDRDSGDTLTEYRARGQEWVAGTPGHRYSVRLTNTTGERVLVVLSVDGVNAVSGQTASPMQAGYVLDPWESAEITGWRKSLEDVAQFVFTDLQDSYAARTGRPDNVGVVGIAVFRERQVVVPSIYQPRVYERDQSRRDRAAMPAPPPAAQAPSASASGRAMAAEAAPRQLGTGHGEREWSPIDQTEFTRASRNPEQVSQLRYDSTRALIAMGVMPRRDWRDDNRGPRAFPNGFVPDPPRW